ncbi:MAG: shikimate dehydrogenase [Actinobacteria bacterium]|nr:shikimate dehydrogenase [Actinomycetota bacterium]
MRVTSKTKLIGLLGNPSRHSLSPLIQNHFLLRYGLDYLYLSFEPLEEDLASAFNGAKSLNFKGLNITMPFKEKIYSLLDWADSTVFITKSVNTVIFDNNSLACTGFSTDGDGLIKSLEDKEFFWDGSKCLVIGAGGAARSALYSLYKKPLKKIYIFDIEYDKSVDMLNTMTAQILMMSDDRTVAISQGANDIKFKPVFKNHDIFKVNKRSAENRNSKIKKIYTKNADILLDGIDSRFKILTNIKDIENEFESLDLIINCTPVGMAINGDKENINRCPLPISWNLKNKYIFDMVYKPLETVLIKKAVKDGAAAVIGGTEMLINQAAFSFNIWFDIMPDKPAIDIAKEIIKKEII